VTGLAAGDVPKLVLGGASGLFLLDLRGTEAFTGAFLETS
jgi:hypothetical protein